MIEDEKVRKIIERKDLSSKDRMLLIYILGRESEPIERTDPITGDEFEVPGVATLPLEQIGEALGKGYKDETTLRKQIQRLVNKGFLARGRKSKGNLPNQYRVTFPQKQPQKPASQPTKDSIEASQNKDLDQAKS